MNWESLHEGKWGNVYTVKGDPLEIESSVHAENGMLKTMTSEKV